MIVDPTCVEALITPRTAAIVAVHLYGMPADMGALATIARRHSIALVEDASQAHGARLHGERVGSLSDAAAFSLYPTKNLGAAGDAGIAVSDDESLLARVRMLANYGERERHHSEVRGHNSRMDELQAALLRVKLGRLDGWNAARRERASQYLQTLAEEPRVELPVITDGADPVWHQFVVRVPDRDLVRRQLAEHGIQTLVHYPVPPHRTVAYAQDHPDPLPITEQLARRVLSLPISPRVTESAAAYVCDTLHRSIEPGG
jgi:dTDP-4-amino-4,6-dideoxygalactose transaminase